MDLRLQRNFHTVTVNYVKILSLLIVLAGLVFSVVPARGQVSSDTTATSGETIALRVGNETVPMNVFQNRVEAVLARAKRKAKKKGKKDFDVGKAREKIENNLKKRLMSRLILDYHAEQSGATVPESKVEEQLKRYYRYAGGKKKFLKRIENRGLTLEQYKQKIRKKLRREIFVRQEIGPVTVTDTEIKKVYEDNKKQLSGYKWSRVERVLRRKIRKRKENRKSKELVVRLREQSNIEINI